MARGDRHHVSPPPLEVNIRLIHSHPSPLSLFFNNATTPLGSGDGGTWAGSGGEIWLRPCFLILPRFFPVCAIRSDPDSHLQPVFKSFVMETKKIK